MIKRIRAGIENISEFMPVETGDPVSKDFIYWYDRFNYYCKEKGEDCEECKNAREALEKMNSPLIKKNDVWLVHKKRL